MKVQTKAPNRRSAQLTSRGGAPGALATPLPAPATRQRSAKQPIRQCGVGSRQTHLQQVLGKRSGRSERTALRFGLTLPAMIGTRQIRCLPAGRSLSLLASLLALLTLACFPVLAQADSSGAQYEEALPNPTGGHGPSHHSEPPAKTSSVPNGGASAPPGTSPSNMGSGESSEVESSSSEAGGVETARKGDDKGRGQGSPHNASTGAASKHAQPTVQTGASTPSGDSSPLVPILIAVAALAAISIGAVMLRQRRQRGSAPGSVSPRAS
jgi:hypothetical protein